MESKSSAKETFGDLKTVGAMLERDPALLHEATLYDRHSALHIAANNGQIQTPLMLAARHGKISCVKKLLEAEANILMFDYVHQRTCLHYAAYYGHADCLQAILSAAQSSTVAVSWGFARFVNIRDGRGATPLHLASRQRGLHLLAITVMIFGIWMSTHHDGWRRSLTLPILGLGSFIFVVSIIGFFGALKKNSILLLIYLIMLCFILVGILVFTVLAQVYSKPKLICHKN